MMEDKDKLRQTGHVQRKPQIFRKSGELLISKATGGSGSFRETDVSKLKTSDVSLNTLRDRLSLFRRNGAPSFLAEGDPFLGPVCLVWTSR